MVSVETLAPADLVEGHRRAAVLDRLKQAIAAQEGALFAWIPVGLVAGIWDLLLPAQRTRSGNADWIEVLAKVSPRITKED